LGDTQIQVVEDIKPHLSIVGCSESRSVRDPFVTPKHHSASFGMIRTAKVDLQPNVIFYRVVAIRIEDIKQVIESVSSVVGHSIRARVASDI